MGQTREGLFSCPFCGHQNAIDILPFCDQERSWTDPTVSCLRCGRSGTLEIRTSACPTGDVAMPEGPTLGRYILGWNCTPCQHFGNMIALLPDDKPATQETFTSSCLGCGSVHRVTVNLVVHFPADPTETCPCCGYVTLYHASAWEICPICFWEDEDVRGDPDFVTGANRLSLRAAQQNFAKFGACDERALQFVRRPLPYHRRDPDWRPYD